MGEFRKSYNSAFLLDRSKLTRMLTVIEKHLSEDKLAFEPKMEVVLKNGKTALLASIEELFLMDNAIKNSIRSLSVDVEVENFHAFISFDSDKFSNIRFSVSGSNQKMVAEIFAEIEEQVERTLLRNWVYRYLKAEWAPLIPVAFILLAIPFLVSFMMANSSQALQLSRSDYAFLASKAMKTTSDHDKIDYLFELSRRGLKHTRSQAFQGLELASWRTVFLLLPAVVIGLIISYTVVACYPWSNFAWGDYEDHYAELVGRRRTLWIAIAISLLIGIVANLFSLSLPSIR
jgi:hypothetical protein